MTCFCLHSKLFNIMTYFWLYDTLFDIMTYFLLRDKLVTSWQTFWRHGMFLMPWRTLWRHDELGDVVTNFVTSLWFFLHFMKIYHDVFFTSCQTFLSNEETFWSNDETFDIMTNFLTSWRVYDIMTNFWCDKLFDVMTYVALIDVITTILTPGTSWQHDAFCWHPDTRFDLMTNLFTRFLSFGLIFSLFREQNIIKTCFWCYN